ncbi:MAG TPA: nuclear transport factor 2 family protein [bacterium]|nr:nuclear transport factor 2 family protein [bacterium]
MNEDIKVAEIQASLVLAQERKYTRIADEYLAALNVRNLQALGKNLHPDLQAVGPGGEVHNKASFLETYQKVFPHIEKVDVTALSRLKNQSTSIYNLVFPAGPVQTTMVMTHEEEEGLIKKIEMIYDTAALQNYLNQKK